MQRMRSILITACLGAMACNGSDPATSETGTDSNSTDTQSTSATDSESTSTTDADTDTGTDSTETTDSTTTAPGMDMDPSGACDSFMQDCPDGEKCVPFRDGDMTGYKCVEVTGSQAAGQSCVYGGPIDATDDCDQDSACWGAKDVNGELVGTCLRFCTGSVAMQICADGSHCIGGGAEIYLCAEGCSPLLQDCADGEGCYWSGQFACNQTTDGFGVGEVCGFTNDCAPGLTCAPSQVVPNCAGSDCCVEFCDVGLDDSQCAAAPGTTCNAFLPPAQAPVGYEHIGVCISI